MGRGPDKHIVKKLVRKYFKFDIKRQTYNSASGFYPQLMDTWNRSGMDSSEAKFIQEKIDKAWEEDEKEYREIKKISKGLPMQMNQLKYKAKNKYAQKGKHKLSSHDLYLPGEKDFENAYEYEFDKKY